jgi:hypothetical protein
MKELTHKKFKQLELTPSTLFMTFMSKAYHPLKTEETHLDSYLSRFMEIHNWIPELLF